MKSIGRKLIIASFIISIIITLVGIAALITRIINGTTGINLDYFYPSCSNNNYANIKYGYTYISLKIQFGANIAAIILGILSFVILFKSFKKAWPDRNIPDDLDADFKMQEIAVQYQAVYILSSLGVISWCLVAGGPLSLWLQGTFCTILNNYDYPIITFISMGGLAIALLLMVIVLALLDQRPEEPQETNGKEITFNDIAVKEVDQLSKKVDDEIKGYISQIQKEREDTKMELLRYQQDIYNKNNPLKDQQQVKEQIKDDDEYQYEYYVQGELPEEDQQSGSHDKQELDEVDFTLSPGMSHLMKNKSVSKVDIDMQKMHPQQIEPGSVSGDINPKFTQQSTPTRSNVNLGDKQSPSPSPQSKYKPTPAKKPQQPKDGWQDFDNFVLGGVDGAPVSEEVSKLLKISLFNNSPFLKTNQRQVECPLQKYLDRDQRFEVTRPEDKFNKKNKRNLFTSRQQLLFSKKRLQLAEFQGRSLREEYNDKKVIKQERIEHIGEDRAHNLQRQQKQRLSNLETRYKKLNLLELIRSKYHN